MIPLDALATERKIGMNCAVTVNYHDLSVRSAEEIAAANFIVEKTVTIYVVENSEKPQLKNLSIFLEFKLLISRIPRRLFHPSEEQQVYKNKFHFHWHIFWGRIFWLSNT